MPSATWTARAVEAQQVAATRALEDPGVWYGAQALRTSCAELGYRC